MLTSVTLTTQPGDGEPEAATPQPLHLVIAWSKEEPHRIGEVAAISGPCVLGRGGDAATDSAPRLAFVRQRPAGAQWRPPLEAPRISRTQLELQPTTDGRLQVRSIGRCVLLINGAEAIEGVVGPGDTLTLRHAAIFLVVRRPKELPALHSRADRRAAGWAFGAADPQGLLGESPPLWALRDMLGFAAQAGRHVLLQGEPGSGRALAARAIHGLSDRAEGPFVECAPAGRQPSLGGSDLLESAGLQGENTIEPRSLFAQAEGGTLFLREVSELPTTLQARLAARLERGSHGADAGTSSGRRGLPTLIASTSDGPTGLHPALATHLAFHVEIPDLNSRREDIPLLFTHLLNEAAQSNPGIASRFFERRGGILAEPRIAPELMDTLLRHHYTLHLRELGRLMWIALSTSRDNVLSLTPALLAELRDATSGSRASPSPSQVHTPSRQEIESALASARQALEQQSQQILQLSDELRRQIEHRARRLMDALSSAQPRAGLGALAGVAVDDLLKPGQTRRGAPRSWNPAEPLGDSYRVVRLLGTGGMGAVYEVERNSDQKRLAAKVLHELPDRTALGRFAREAYIMARCNHRNLLSVWDIDFAADGTLFLVMELVLGSSLWQQRRRFGELPWALSILRQIAEALHALHSQGVVHRDLKPENVLLSAQPGGGVLVKLADFGISRLIDGTGEPNDSQPGSQPSRSEGAQSAQDLAQRVADLEALHIGQQATLAQLAPRTPGGEGAPEFGGEQRQRTGTGVIFGTPLYMAPELLQGSRNAEAPADVFSFGVVAYELLSSEPAFAKAPMLLHAAGQFVPPVSLHSRCPSVPSDLGQLIDRCLVATPGERPSMGTVLQVLGRSLFASA
jgi:serine/threonine protein kinase/DNA-binding NtrC family response regulator